MSFVICKIGNVYSLIKDTYHIVNIDKDGKLNISGCCNADDIQTNNRGRILINDLEDIVKSQKPELLKDNKLKEENQKLKKFNDFLNLESRELYLENEKLKTEIRYLRNTLSNIEKLIEVNK